jgi:hypothetical protein
MDRPVNPLVDLLLTLAAAGVEVRGNRPFLLHRPRQLPLGLAERLDRHREALLVLLQQVDAGVQPAGCGAWLIAVAGLLSGRVESTDTIRETEHRKEGDLWA